MIMKKNGHHAPQRRRMWNKDDQELHARHTQASRDALRRRQKVKKSKIVKRHVLYKQKQGLLKQLAEDKPLAPIVASQLGRPGMHLESDSDSDHHSRDDHDDGGDDDDDIQPAPSAPSSPIGENEVTTDLQTSQKELPCDVNKIDSGEQEEQHRNLNRNAQSEIVDEGSKEKPCAYVPFAKQRKEYEQRQKELEQQRHERLQSINSREEMLSDSRKNRRERSKQYRKKTKSGQPKLKHRIESILAQVQRQRQAEHPN